MREVAMKKRKRAEPTVEVTKGTKRKGMAKKEKKGEEEMKMGMTTMRRKRVEKVRMRIGMGLRGPMRERGRNMIKAALKMGMRREVMKTKMKTQTKMRRAAVTMKRKITTRM